MSRFQKRGITSKIGSAGDRHVSDRWNQKMQTENCKIDKKNPLSICGRRRSEKSKKIKVARPKTEKTFIDNKR